MLGQNSCVGLVPFQNSASYVLPFFEEWCRDNLKRPFWEDGIWSLETLCLITIFLLSSGKIFGPPKKVEVDDDKSQTPAIPSIRTDASGPLLDTIEEEMDLEFAEILKKLPVAVQISDSVSCVWQILLGSFTQQNSYSISHLLGTVTT